jgi:glyceraldehyde 3-phosphate dehydrogenase
MRIAINGLGRIGRCVARALFELNVKGIELVAVNGPARIEDHAHLIKYDSVHGIFPGEVAAEGEHLRIGAMRPLLLRERDPSLLPWRELGVDIVLECTGKFNNRDAASVHLAAGAKKVLVSAPCDNADATIVYGVNHADLLATHEVISIGSCTTNCLAPIAQALHQTIGIEHGFMTTVHAYTNDQNLVDGSHKDMRRARAGALSMIPSSTGAAKAIGLVIPELSGKLGGSAVRVPVANVSMVDFTFVSKQATTKEKINAILKEHAEGAMQGVLYANTLPLVSVDFTHHPASAIADLTETSVIDGYFCRVVGWYDNEWGFSARMLDMAKLVGTTLS